MKALEDKRREEVIGSSLEAKIIFRSGSNRDLDYFHSFKDFLPDLFIVSQAEVKQDNKINEGLSKDFPETSVTIEKADGRKCARSWKYTTDVGEDSDYPTLSLKSAQIVKEILNAKKEDS